MKFENEAREIVRLVGGESNINSLVHCATRLRFELKDGAKFKKEDLEKLSYVLKVLISGGQYQVVIGPNVDNYYEAILSTTKIQGNKKTETVETEKVKISDRILKVISGAFSPLIPLMAGSGMIKALLTLFTTIGVMSDTSSTYLILSAAGNACFYFMPVFLGITISKQLKANAFVGGAIGAALLEPNFMGLIDSVDAVSFLGIPVTPINYSATIFPIFIAILVYAYLDKGLRKITPQSLQYFLVPMICLMLMVPFTVIVFGPVGTTIGNYVSDFVMWLFSLSGTLAGIVLGATYPFLTMLGLHWGFTPITLQNLDLVGGDIIEGVCVCAVWAQMGIALGAYLKAKKNSKLKSIAGPTFITGFFAGVTEPILYSIVMEYKRLMVVVAIGGACGGAVAGTLGVTMDAYVFHNIFSALVMSYSPIWAYAIAVIVSLIVATALTYVWGLNGLDAEKAKDLLPENETVEDTSNGIMRPVEIASPLDGKEIALKDVDDEVFASGVTGKGIAIIPENNTVLSPADGTVSVLFPSKHAVGITTKEGIEILVHIGLNTVMLNGEGFTTFVKQGDQVKKGQKLLAFDKDFIKSKGCSLQSPLIITNADQFKDILIETKTEIRTGDIAMEVIV
ncbi:MAG: beta-glucoside-specific PTS transporter subunit IIABC [Faecalicoccus sp.]|uniref:beta-glucoside-specific PTS transporter subunit IIABC n=1 Tax=Faecalicoccus sp. TaxID=1971758 RepID=UPI002A82E417|nr:beta-glucoside-specific PTS transporter subunit IIABC [Faecalicoccus sp.]MCI6380059.1 beta-glucoside-specific PTS transporter subunit IIABC [Erysipelotrichaceae bacterium]MDY4279308.1 beta-glucoside-specific PTS transporter subunit IIABC [Faecalicoccus sp.]MDY4869686.1 beta-glucoside-specific PTS transporter subunit IIABC [Faecalicoccus sp.]